MNIDDLTVGDAKALVRMFGTGGANDTDSGLRILVLQRGWVVVGQFTRIGDQCTVAHGYVVRRWGTGAGLGELAEKGPLEKTILDPVTTVRFHQLGIVAQFDCNAVNWGNKCK